MLNIVNCIASCHLGCYINVMFDLDYLFEIIQNSHWPISYESAYNPSNPSPPHVTKAYSKGFNYTE